MKFYKKWKTEIGVAFECPSATLTGIKTKPFRIKEEVYVGVQYTDGTSCWYKRRKAYREDQSTIKANVEDCVANFHTDSLEAYKAGDYRIDEKFREREHKSRNDKHIRKMDFLKGTKIEGAKYLYDFYRSITAAGNEKLPPKRMPKYLWNRWHQWKSKNPEKHHYLISKIKAYEQSCKSADAKRKHYKRRDD